MLKLHVHLNHRWLIKTHFFVVYLFIYFFKIQEPKIIKDLRIITVLSSHKGVWPFIMASEPSLIIRLCNRIRKSFTGGHQALSPQNYVYKKYSFIIRFCWMFVSKELLFLFLFVFLMTQNFFFFFFFSSSLDSGLQSNLGATLLN